MEGEEADMDALTIQGRAQQGIVFGLASDFFCAVLCPVSGARGEFERYDKKVTSYIDTLRKLKGMLLSI